VPKNLTGQFDLRLKYDVAPFDVKTTVSKLSL